jgi:uracil-DNA glycosylase
MNVKIEESWQNVLQEEFEKPYFKNLVSFVKDEYTSQKVYPPGSRFSMLSRSALLMP